MTINLSDYIQKLGLAGIVIISSKWTESSSGHKEYTTEEIICHKGGNPCKMKVQEKINFYNGKSDLRILEEERISEVEYQKLCQEHGGPIDTEDYRKKLRKNSGLIKKIEELTPLCPQCQTQMVQRKSQYGEFWGCACFPKCNEIRSLDFSTEKELNHIRQELEKS